MSGPRFPFEFTCQRSGNCCSIPGGFVRVTDEEIAGIARHLGMTEAGVRSRFVQARGDRLVEGPDSRCIFLDGSRPTACRIYPARPEKCRTWPHWPELAHNPAAVRRAADRCPGIRPHDPGADLP